MFAAAPSREIDPVTTIVFPTELEAQAWIRQEGHHANSEITREVAADASFYDGEWGEVRDTAWRRDPTWTAEVRNES